MPRISEHFIDELKDRIRVSDIVGRHVKLKRAGREFAGLSPFTNEKTPSFFVNDEKRFYHCFSSGKHGDIISFLMEYEGLEFIEAIETLAESAGMELPKYTPEQKKEDDSRKLMLDAISAAQHFFQKQLFTTDGKPARDYLKARGLNKNDAAKWGLGFAPANYNSMKEALQGHRKDILIKAGLLKENARGSFSFFRNRLTIPILDRRGRPISFGARALDPDGKPKYLNGPDSPIFNKSKTLYGIDKAKNEIARNRSVNGLLMAEGYLDVIALAKAGIKTGVSPLGTSVTESHLTELWRYGTEPIICLDGDQAGQRAALKVIDMALPRIGGGRTILFAKMPSGLDPDDVLRQRGADALKAIVNTPTSMPLFLWESERNAEPLNTPERRAGFKARLAEHLGKIKDKETARHYREVFFQWTRNHYRRGNKQQSTNLQGGVAGHRGLGILVRCIDNKNLLDSTVDKLAMVKGWAKETQDIFDVVFSLYMADIEISRSVIIDTLLVDMKSSAADALEMHPQSPPISSNSPAWNMILRGIDSLCYEAEEPATTLAAAMSNQKRRRDFLKN